MALKIFSSLMFIFALFFAYIAFSLDIVFSYEPVGPKPFPLLLMAIIAICSLILLVKYEMRWENKQSLKRVSLGVLILLFYAFVFEFLGFILATILLTTFLGLLFHGDWRYCLAWGFCTGIGFYFLFDKALDIVLPLGILQGLT